jgi:hypothetical protein
MKYVVTHAYLVNVPEKGSDKWNKIVADWKETDPEQWTGDYGRWEPNEEDMAKFMVDMSYGGEYDGDVELQTVIATNTMTPARPGIVQQLQPFEEYEHGHN